MPTGTGSSGIMWFMGWGIILVMLWGMSKFGPTKILLYWLLWLTILWQLLGHATELQDLMNAAFTQFVPSGSGSGSSGSSGSIDTQNTTNSTSQTITKK
jgi:hypothetical protein